MIDFKEDEKLSVLNHSCAHVMAQAIKHLYPQAKFWVGPVVSEGFYYDVDLGNDVIKDEDIPKIEKEMKKICKDGKRIVRQEISKDEALEMFKDDEYKIDLQLEYMLVSGMFAAFFELIIHDVPYENAKQYVQDLRMFYTAGWQKIMGF